MPEPATNEDADLIRAAQRGDLEAFATLVMRHHSSVRACLAVRMNNPHDAEDLAQETLVVAFRRLPECDLARPLGPWLRAIAMNLLANYRRKFRAEPLGMSSELEAMLDSQIEHGSGRESATYHALCECLETLDVPSRELVNRRYAEGASLEDLAQAFQRKTSAISMQLHRLRLALAQCIQDKVAQPAP